MIILTVPATVLLRQHLVDGMTLRRFGAGAADGFNLRPDLLPDGLGILVDTVVPILQRGGLFRHDYLGTTLRDHPGLERPAGRFAATGATALA